MALTDEARRDIMQTYIKIISHVADREYQNRIWIRAVGPDCEDYDEFINYFFSESESIIKGYKNFGITDAQCLLLAKFIKEIENFDRSDRDRLPEQFLRSAAWKKIMGIANDILKAFGKELPVVAEDKEEVLKRFIANIAHATDEEYQEKFWIQKLEPKRDNFYTFVTQFYYDSDHILENYRDFGLTDEQHRLLIKFSKELAL